MTVERDRNTYRVYEKVPSSPGLIFRAHAFTIIEDDERKLITAGHVISNIPHNNSLIFFSNDNQEMLTNPKFSPRRKWDDVVESNVEGEGGFIIANRIENRSEIFVYSPCYSNILFQLRLLPLESHKFEVTNSDPGKCVFKGCSGSPILNSSEEIIGVLTHSINGSNNFRGIGFRIKTKNR